MQFKFGLCLRRHGDHARVVGTRREFGEPYVVATHKEFDAEESQAGTVAGLRERIGDGLSHCAGAFQGGPAHGHGLPGFDVVATFLAVPDSAQKLVVTVPEAASQERTVSRVIS